MKKNKIIKKIKDMIIKIKNLGYSYLEDKQIIGIGELKKGGIYIQSILTFIDLFDIEKDKVIIFKKGLVKYTNKKKYMKKYLKLLRWIWKNINK